MVGRLGTAVLLVVLTAGCLSSPGKPVPGLPTNSFSPWLANGCQSATALVFVDEAALQARLPIGFTLDPDLDPHLGAGFAKASTGVLLLEMLKCKHAAIGNASGPMVIADLATYVRPPYDLASNWTHTDVFHFATYASDAGTIAWLQGHGVNATKADVNLDSRHLGAPGFVEVRFDAPEGTYSMRGLMAQDHIRTLHTVAWAKANGGLARWDYTLALPDGRQNVCEIPATPEAPASPCLPLTATFQPPAGSWASGLVGAAAAPAVLVTAREATLQNGTLSFIPWPPEPANTQLANEEVTRWSASAST